MIIKKITTQTIQKVVWILLGIFIILFVLISCTQKKEEKRLHIGLTVITSQHTYFQSIMDGWKELAEKEGFRLTIMDPAFDNAKLAKIIEDLISLHVDGVAYAPLSGITGPTFMKQLKEAGIPVVGYNIDEADWIFGEDSTPVVCADNYQGGGLAGKSAGEYWMKNFPGVEPKIAIISQPESRGCQLRVKGFLDKFKETYQGKFEVVADLDGKGLQDKASQVMDDILQAHKEVNLVFGINDSSILGALASIESAGRGTADKELLVGYDASEPALKYVVDPKSALKIEVGNPPRDQVNQAYNLLSKMIKGEEVPDRVKVNFCLVTAEDADKWLSEQYPKKR